MGKLPQNDSSASKNYGLLKLDQFSSGADSRSAVSEGILGCVRPRNKNREIDAKIQQSKALLLEQLKTFQDPGSVVIDCKNKS